LESPFYESLKEFCRRECERTTPIPGGAASNDFRQGASIGHNLRAMFALLESPPKPEELSPANVQAFNKTRRWLREQVSAATMLPTRARAVQYLRGVLYGLTFAAPASGDADTDQLRRIFIENLAEIEGCRTQKAVAGVLKRHLPQDKVKRWNTEQHAAFDNRARRFCRAIGFRPAKRGRPTK